MNLSEIIKSLSEQSIEVSESQLKTELPKLGIELDEINAETIGILAEHFQALSSNALAPIPATSAPAKRKGGSMTRSQTQKPTRKPELQYRNPPSFPTISFATPTIRNRSKQQYEAIEQDALAIVRDVQGIHQAKAQLEEFQLNLLLRMYGLSDEGSFEEKSDRLDAFFSEQEQEHEETQQTIASLQTSISDLMQQAQADLWSVEV